MRRHELRQTRSRRRAPAHGHERGEEDIRDLQADVQTESLKVLVEQNNRALMVGGLSTLATLGAEFWTIGYVLKWF